METHLNSQDLSLAICLVMGALHALEPGHGKTALVAHLITEKKNYWKPLALAVTTSLTHAASILLISLLIHGLLYTAFSIETNDFVDIMNGVSGLILVSLGVYIFSSNRKSRAHAIQLSEISPDRIPLSPLTSHFGRTGTAGHLGGCACPTHRLQVRLKASTSQSPNKTWRTILIGFAVGLIPCPSALGALSAALASEDLSATVGIIAMFSLGIFLSLMMAGSILAKYSFKVLNNSFSKKRPNLASNIQTAVFLATGIWHISIFAG